MFIRFALHDARNKGKNFVSLPFKNMKYTTLRARYVVLKKKTSECAYENQNIYIQFEKSQNKLQIWLQVSDHFLMSLIRVAFSS